MPQVKKMLNSRFDINRNYICIWYLYCIWHYIIFDINRWELEVFAILFSLISSQKSLYCLLSLADQVLLHKDVPICPCFRTVYGMERNCLCLPSILSIQFIFVLCSPHYHFLHKDSDFWVLIPSSNPWAEGLTLFCPARMKILLMGRVHCWGMGVRTLNDWTQPSATL